jgi:pyruvate,orthophosphate dikinase
MEAQQSAVNARSPAPGAREIRPAGDPVRRVCVETSREDIAGMNVAEAILAVRGVVIHHLAVVVWGMGTCCVAGRSDIVVDYWDGYCIRP